MLMRTTQPGELLSRTFHLIDSDDCVGSRGSTRVSSHGAVSDVETKHFRKSFFGGPLRLREMASCIDALKVWIIGGLS